MSAEKEKPVKHNAIAVALKTIFRIIAILIFGVFILLSFSVLNTKGAVIMVLIAAIGIILTLPHANKIIREYLKIRLTTKIKLAALIILFVLSFTVFLPSSFRYDDANDAVKLVKQWTNYGSYNSIDELIDSLQEMQRLSSGAVHEQIVLDYNYLVKLNQQITEFKQICSEAKQLGQNRCDNKFTRLKMQATTKLISKEIIQRHNDSVEIKAKITRTTQTGSNKTESTKEIVYVVRKVSGIWKVDDILTDGKYLSGTIDLQKSSEENEQSMAELSGGLVSLKKWVAYQELISTLKRGVQDALPNNQIINFEVGQYNKQENQFVVGVTYYFKGQWPADNYLWFERDATKIYQSMFTGGSNIMQVQITAKELYKDNYGTTQERLLAKSLMNKPTADKINWAGFDSTKLDSIAQVSFYGESTYKNLKNLEAALTSWQATQYFYDYAAPAQSNVCEDIRYQCQTYGDCDDYESINSLGIC